MRDAMHLLLQCYFILRPTNFKILLTKLSEPVFWLGWRNCFSKRWNYEAKNRLIINNNIILLTLQLNGSKICLYLIIICGWVLSNFYFRVSCFCFLFTQTFSELFCNKSQEKKTFLFLFGKFWLTNYIR